MKKEIINITIIFLSSKKLFYCISERMLTHLQGGKIELGGVAKLLG